MAILPLLRFFHLALLSWMIFRTHHSVVMDENPIIDIFEQNLTHLNTDSYSSIYWQYNFQIQVILYKQGTTDGIAKLISFDFKWYFFPKIAHIETQAEKENEHIQNLLRYNSKHITENASKMTKYLQ